MDVATSDLRLLLLTSQRMLGINVLRADHDIQGCQVYAFGTDDKIHPDDLSELETALSDAITAIRMLRKS